MNNSQNPLNPQPPKYVPEQNKHGGTGMLDLEIQDKIWSSKPALPLTLTGQPHSSVRPTLRAQDKEAKAWTAQ
jgi:hypothetical protein